jgi:hypothetical protein
MKSGKEEQDEMQEDEGNKRNKGVAGESVFGQERSGVEAKGRVRADTKSGEKGGIKAKEGVRAGI